MANWLQRMIYGDSVQLDLKRLESPPAQTGARLSMIQADPLDVSINSLLKYSRKSELVYACIEKKSQAACDAEIIVERMNTDGEYEPVDGHPLVALLEMPNEYDDGESFRRAWVASENFADWFVCEIQRSNAGKIVGLWPLHPGHIMEDWRPDGRGGMYLAYYVYTVNGQQIYYRPEELMIRRRHGLGSVYAGVSALSVALSSVDADIALTEYVRAFFRNSGIPSGLLKISGKNLSQEEVTHLGQLWDTKFAARGMRQGGTAVLDQNAEYSVIGAKLHELESSVLTEIEETRICMAFGVPPVLIGSYVGLKNVNQKASFKGAMEEFWMNTMSPELKGIRKFLTRHLLPEFESMDAIIAGTVRVNWDMSHVAALQEDLDLIYKRTVEAYQGGILTLNEARGDIGVDAIEGEEGDAFYSAPAPVAPGDNQPPPAPPKQLSPYLESLADKPFMQEYIRNGLERLFPDENGNGSKKNFELRREPTAVEQTVDIKAIFDSYESGKEALTKVVLDIRGDLIKQAAASVTDYTDKEVHELVLTPPAGAYKQVQKIITQSINEGRNQILQHGGAKRHLISYGLEYKGGVDDLIRRLVELTVSRVINEVQSAASSIIAALGVLGLDRNDIESRIEQELDERSDAPFEGIARQAVNSAVNAGRKEEMQAREDEIEYFYYSAILDKNICPQCEAWEGAEASSMDQLPDTPNPECDGLSNCRCFVIAVFEGEGQ